MCEEDFLKLIEKHAETFKTYGKILPMSHEIITEFAVTLNATRKGIHLKIKKYLEVSEEVSQFFCIEKKQQIINDDDDDDESEKENTETVDSEYGNEKEGYQTVLLFTEERQKLIPVEIGEKRPQMPDNWTFYVSEILWEAGIKTECAYSFVNGNIIGGELETTATCSECGANFSISTEQDFTSKRENLQKKLN